MKNALIMQMRACVGRFLYKKMVINANTVITAPKTNTPHVGVKTSVCAIAAPLSGVEIETASLMTVEIPREVKL